MSENQRPSCARPDPSPRKPDLTVPEGACDCHAHIMGPLARFPFERDRSYDPPEALLSAYWCVLTTLGLTRAVIVQPSVYGTDNRATLAAIQVSEGTFRGVAVVEPTVDDHTLSRFHEAGIRGLRINPLFKGDPVLADYMRLATRIKDMGWHLQFFLDVSKIDADVKDLIERLPVPVVFDHMGYMPTGKGLDNPGFRWLLKQLADGRAWVKLSGAYYLGQEPGPYYADVTPFARALIEANPARCLWATNWPHPMTTKPMANDGDLLDLLAEWVPNGALRRRILVDNPAMLYGFP